MSSCIDTLRLRLGKPLTREESLLSDRIYAEYCDRPQHRYRLTRYLKASLRAAANRYARYGLPPRYNQRLAYRMHKKRRAKALAIAIYGDPATAKLLARDVPAGEIKPPKR